MMWQLQLFGETLMRLLFTEPALNLLFAALCVLASLGFCPRWTMRLSALLYLGFALLTGAG